jgi:hypothetical protein
MYRTLRTINPIENLNGSVASALSDATTRMRKVRGCGLMRTLLKALDGRRPESDNGAVLKAT